MRIPLTLTPQPKGGFTVTSPLKPELLIEGEIVEEAIAHVQDALAAPIENYEDLQIPFPTNLIVDAYDSPIQFEFLTPVSRRTETWRFL